MLLHTLLREFDPQIALDGLPLVEVRSVQEDSRRVRVGDVFVARPGTQTDGRAYITDAARRGAIVAVVAAVIDQCPLPQVVARDIKSAASVLANILAGQPSRRMKVLGVTGTNGKTTVTYLLRHILNQLDRRCGLVGTVEFDDGLNRREASQTTPGPVELAELLTAMADNGCQVCVMEVSSHALDQGRAAGVRYAGAAFTNLTHDHLDYHDGMDDYAAAKAKLFEMLDESGVAVVNAEDPYSGRMVRDCRGRIVRWGFGPDADYRAEDVSITAAGSKFVLVTPDGRRLVEMSLAGRHNIANALTAAALLSEVMALSVHQIAMGLKSAGGAPGRLQPVNRGQRFTVLVDYAHTDDALKNVLTALRPLCRRGRLHVLFGCGGDRDRKKRPLMAKVAEQYADVVCVTSDNPRTENPRDILDQIVAGLSADIRSGRSSKQLIVQVDRRRAIEAVIGSAGDGDIVLLAGKGHENYQTIGAEKHHFDDVEEATRVLESIRAERAAPVENER